MFPVSSRTLLLFALISGLTVLLPMPVSASEGCAALTPEVHTTPECEAEMANAPVPNVLPLEPDQRF